MNVRGDILRKGIYERSLILMVGGEDRENVITTQEYH